MLRIDGLSAWYGEAQALREVSLHVDQGEIVTLVGRNGAGKTTLLRCLMGLHGAHGRIAGTISLSGADITGRAPHGLARRGLGYVPDDRGIFASLSVEENLTLPPVMGPDPWSLERVYETFPMLRERRRFPGTKLSGGEQQMLALARVLRTGARLLLCDEPTEGLSPLIVQRIGEILREVKEAGVTVLLIEQNVHFAATVADRHYLLAEGRIVESLDRDQVREREHELLDYLGI
ncbi:MULTISPECIES: ABC transporter ATP-binding protein [Actinomadura]|uniref:Amino acid/amide ABC transporter ATP-binding protein 2, HAAT family n=1 Tax=Actinomadura madurae TaxID=1993 RepID=A0A1I5Y336_9ACTN|nr:ABC transporter ATP-binding protein [Actinomadura madurae]SFQ38613.1 amino acid/amide ABC transporter ATP-binding protein 2, HAAT family [Actinomadura madurae]SPT49999.1 LIV-I protein F [Actinomadura madurae]